MLISLYNFIKTLSEESGIEALEKIKEYEQAGGDPLSVSSKGSNALHVCAYIKRWDLAEYFLTKGVNPHAKNQVGHSFLGLLKQDKKEKLSDWEQRFPILLQSNPQEKEFEAGFSEIASSKRPQAKNAKNAKRKKKVVDMESACLQSNASVHLEEAIYSEAECQELDKKVLALICAQHWGDLDILLQNNTCPVWKDGAMWETVLDVLSKEDIVQVLKYAEHFEKSRFITQSPFYYLVSLKKAVYFNMFLGHGFDINALNGRGLNVLEEMLLEQNMDAIELLCASGASSIGKKAVFNSLSAAEYAKQHISLDVFDMLSDCVKDQSYFLDKKAGYANASHKSKKSKKNKALAKKGIFVAKLESNLKEASEYQEMRPNDSNVVVIVKKKRLPSLQINGVPSMEASLKSFED